MDHPHVVTVYDHREHDDLRLLVMELLPATTSRCTGSRVSRRPEVWDV
jgi:hypothetical protein